jgi:hypothetical protein
MEKLKSINVNGQKVLDGTKLSDDGIIAYLHSVILTFKLSNTSAEIYGGITGNIAANLSRHNITEYITCVLVDSFDIAARIEQRLHNELGCYIGKNGQGGKGGNEDSKYVYIVQRNQVGFTD